MEYWWDTNMMSSDYSALEGHKTWEGSHITTHKQQQQSFTPCYRDTHSLRKTYMWIFFFQNRLYIKISSIMHLHYKQFIHYRNIIKHKAKPDQFITMQYVITYNGWKRKNIFFIKNSSFFTLLFLLWSVAQSAAQYTCSIGILKYCRPRPTLSGLWWQTLITLVRGLEYKYVGKWVGNICLNLMWCVGERVILCVQSQSALNKESHFWLCACE